MLFLVQLNIAGGVSSGYWVCYGSSRIDSSIQWRLPFIISTVLAVSVAVGAAFLPHSPRWLLLHNRRADAERVLDKLVGDSVEDMAERREMLAVTIAPKGSKRAAAVAMWRKDVRWRSCLGIGIQMLQMLSGMCVHTFLYLSSPPSVSLTLIDLSAATLCAFPPATSRSSSPSLTSPRPQPLLRRQPLPAGGPDGRDGKLPRRRLDRHLRCVLLRARSSPFSRTARADLGLSPPCSSPRHDRQLLLRRPCRAPHHLCHRRRRRRYRSFRHRQHVRERRSGDRARQVGRHRLHRDLRLLVRGLLGRRDSAVRPSSALPSTLRRTSRADL